MRKLLLNIHIYAGLLCFSYLIIFGITSLDFNHPTDFTKRNSAKITWEQPIQLPDLPRTPVGALIAQKDADTKHAVEIVRDALGLFGHPITMQSGWTDENTYHAIIQRPGKAYLIDYQLNDNRAVVTEIPAGFWETVRQLHGRNGVMPASLFVSSWTWYTELCTWTVIFAALSGIYLWTRRKNERNIGVILLSSATLLSLAIISYFIFHG